MNLSLRVRGFTLIELLTVISIIAVIAALLVPVLHAVQRSRDQTVALSNMRQVGIAFFLFAGENNYELPGRSTGQNGNDRWPKVLARYIKDPRIYAAPGDPKNYLLRKADPLSNQTNNTSFIMNGYNDLGTMEDPSTEIRINRFDSTGNTLLLGTPHSGSRHFFMDFLEPPHGNHRDVLNLTAYGEGSNYLFADGSARFIQEKDYHDTLWLADKSYQIPKL
jgi:prepilin-type N-terminal cleavage/methylation domain-containing protein/prepilin-type processing-associated H-X9-DG protein